MRYGITQPDLEHYVIIPKQRQPMNPGALSLGVLGLLFPNQSHGSCYEVWLILSHAAHALKPRVFGNLAITGIGMLMSIRSKYKNYCTWLLCEACTCCVLSSGAIAVELREEPALGYT